MNPYNIRKISSYGIPRDLSIPGQVTILGDPDKLGKYAGQVYQDMRGGIDIEATLTHFDLRVYRGYEGISDYIDANIICPINNPLTDYDEFIIASAEPEKMGLAAVEIMKEVEKWTRSYYKQFIALFSLGAPSAFRYVVEEWYSRAVQKYSVGIISFKSRKKKRAQSTDRLYSPLFNNRKYTEQQIKDTYMNLPERYSELYRKRNPEANEILKYSLDMMNPDNSLVALLLETAKKDRNLLQNLYKAKQRIASQYKLELKKWSAELSQDFSKTYRYCLYLIDPENKKIPVKFVHRPSYCLYIMYMLDRNQKKELVSDISFKENQLEFKKLYHELLSEDVDKIESVCDTMLHRKKSGSDNLRKGRYDEYIKDISDAFDELVGCPDSIALKVGNGQFLQIPPDKIIIDHNLPRFSFS